MSKILKNQTASPISISDTGVSLPASPATYTIPSQDYLLWAASSNIITHIGSGNVVVNDGSTDLSISNGTDLIKGLFPQRIGITAGTDFTQIGHTSDNLNTAPRLGTPNLTSSGSLAALNAALTTTSLDSVSTVGVTITGTWVGTLSFEGRIDSSNWFSLNAIQYGTGTIISSTTSNTQVRLNATGLAGLRVIFSAYTSGTAVVTQVSTLGVSNKTHSFLQGGTTGALIGNTNDRLRVETDVLSTNTKFLYEDMNATTGGVARDTAITTAYTTIYNRNGSGYLFGFTVTLEGNLVGGDPWTIKLVVDSVTLFELTSLDFDAAFWALDTSTPAIYLGLEILNSKTIRFRGPQNLAIKYASNITIQAKKTTGASKRFRAGLVSLTRD